MLYQGFIHAWGGGEGISWDITDSVQNMPVTGYISPKKIHFPRRGGIAESGFEEIFGGGVEILRDKF